MSNRCFGQCYEDWPKIKANLRETCLGLTDSFFSEMTDAEKRKFMTFGACRCLPFNALMLAVTSRNAESIACLLKHGADVNGFKSSVGAIFFFDCREHLSVMDKVVFPKNAFSDKDGENHLENIKNSVHTMVFARVLDSFGYCSHWLDDVSAAYQGPGKCNTFKIEKDCIDLFLDFPPSMKCIKDDDALSMELPWNCPCDTFARILTARGLETFNILQTIMRLKARTLCFIKVDLNTVDRFPNLKAGVKTMLTMHTEYKNARVYFMSGKFTNSKGAVIKDQLVSAEMAHEDSLLDDTTPFLPTLYSKALMDDFTTQTLTEKFMEFGQSFRWPCFHYIEDTQTRQIILQEQAPLDLYVLARDVVALCLKTPLLESVQRLRDQKLATEPALRLIEDFEVVNRNPNM